MLLDAEKAFDKIQHPFMTKQTNTTQHTKIIREFFSLKKGICKERMVIIVLNGE